LNENDGCGLFTVPRQHALPYHLDDIIDLRHSEIVAGIANDMNNLPSLIFHDPVGQFVAHVRSLVARMAMMIVSNVAAPA
jgi:hypothetical protein